MIWLVGLLSGLLGALVAWLALAVAARKPKPPPSGDFPFAGDPEDAFARARRERDLMQRVNPGIPRPQVVLGSDDQLIRRGDTVWWRGDAWEVFAVEPGGQLIVTSDGSAGQRAPAAECTKVTGQPEAD